MAMQATRRRRGAKRGAGRGTGAAGTKDQTGPGVGADADRGATPNAVNRTVLRRLVLLSRPYWRWLLAGGICLLIASLLGLVLPQLVRGLIDGIFVSRGRASLRPTVIGLVAVFGVQALFNFGQTYLLSYTGERLVADLRRRLYGHLQGLSTGFFDGNRVGELMSRLTNDVSAIQQSITSNLLTFVQQVVFLVGALVLVLATDWRLAAIVLALVPPIVVTGAIFGRRLQTLANETQAELGTATTVLEETIAGARTVKAFAREEYEVERYGESVGRVFAVAMRRTRLRSVFGPLMGLFVALGITGVLVFGVREVGAGRLTPGELVSSLMYMLLVAGPIGALTGVYAQLREASGAAERLFELMDTTPEVVEAPGAAPLPAPAAGRVRLEGISFRYAPTGGEAPTVLRGVSLDVAPGETLALVGPSGAGKSTLVNLLLRFYDPIEGRITIDGHDTRAVTLRSLREAIGVVPQDPVLFGGTIRENIAYGRLGAVDDEIVAAARAANAHGFIADLPGGYEAIVGERGVKLSGGQRQRIAIARAILKDPRLLILDEATSSLDTEAEAAVQVALERLMRGRTTIVIAHRLSTVERADRIVVLDRGRIVEEGRHADLLARGGLYARLYHRKFRDEAPGDGDGEAAGADGAPVSRARWGLEDKVAAAP